jgi:hypothetical protein
MSPDEPGRAIRAVNAADGGHARPRRHLLVSLLVLACSTLPAPAAPQDGRPSAGVGDEDLIRYRILHRADFKGRVPPAGTITRGEYELAATTCVDVRADPPVSVQVVSITGPGGDTRYEGRIRHAQFRAFMDRACSWWNPNSRNAEYTLQHEQIHFAIVEVATRRLNEAARHLVSQLRVTADTHQDAVRAVRTRVEALFDEHDAAARRRERDFDADTSLGRNDQRQQEWWRRIERELRDSRGQILN